MPILGFRASRRRKIDLSTEFTSTPGRKGVVFRSPNGKGEPLPAPPSPVFVVNAVAAPQGVANGERRKSGAVVIRRLFRCTRGS
jgi:hypothetical protein